MGEGTVCLATDSMVAKAAREAMSELLDDVRKVNTRRHIYPSIAKRTLREESRRHGKLAPKSANWYPRRATAEEICCKKVAPEEWDSLETVLRGNSRAATTRPPSAKRTERRARKKRAKHWNAKKRTVQLQMYSEKNVYMTL